MGYRSKVAIASTTEGCKKLASAWEAAGAGEPDSMEDNGMGNSLIRWDDVKWYPELPEVQAVKLTLEEFLNNRVPYIFVRVGEDCDDIKTDACDDERLSIHIWPQADIMVDGFRLG